MKIIVVMVALAGVGLSSACADVGRSAEVGATVRVENCGQSLSVVAEPRRAVGLEQNATEIMLSLGLADRMVGTSYQTDPVLPELKSAYDSVPVLAKLYPSREAVLEAGPDFVYSTFASAYAPDAAGARETLGERGIPAYLSRFACEKPADVVGTVGFDGLFAEFDEVARIFGVPERGTDLVTRQRARLDAAVEAAEGSGGGSVLWYYSGTSTPYVAGAGGMPAAISAALEVRNVYGDVRQAWPAGSWEQIAQRDPDVIVLADLTRGGDGDSAQSKRDYLRNNPVTSKLDAVREGRFITVPGSSMDPSVRSVAAVEQVSAGLRELGR